MNKISKKILLAVLLLGATVVPMQKVEAVTAAGGLLVLSLGFLGKALWHDAKADFLDEQKTVTFLKSCDPVKFPTLNNPKHIADHSKNTRRAVWYALAGLTSSVITLLYVNTPNILCSDLNPWL